MPQVWYNHNINKINPCNDKERKGSKMTKQTEKILTNKAKETVDNFLSKYVNKTTDGYHGQLVEVSQYPIQDVTKNNLSPKGYADSVVLTENEFVVIEMKTNGGDITEMLKDYNKGLNYIIIYGMFSGYNKKFKKNTGLKIFSLQEFIAILLKYNAIKSRSSQGGYNIDYRHGLQCEVSRGLDYNRCWDFTLFNINDVESSVARMNEEYITRS